MSTFVRRHAGLIGINLLCLLTLLPFINKPFHLDDPTYLWPAQQIRQHPLDPFGFDINWYGTRQRMSEAAQNPPLVSYYLAAASLLLGWSEVAMHAAMLLPALGLASGVYVLARRMCDRPVLAAAAFVLAPATWVSCTTVMCDVPMLCLYVWAIYLWVRGIDERRAWFLIAAALAALASALCKYFGITAVPLMIAYALLRGRRGGWWITPLLIPVALLIAYHLWTRATYGHGLVAQAAAYAVRSRGNEIGGVVTRAIVLAGFVGGCGATVALAWIISSPRRATLLLALAIVAILALALHRPLTAGLAHTGGVHRARAALQLGLFAAGGVLLIVVSVRGWRRERDADATLLLLWIAGTLVFVACLNWTINGRVILPMLPALAMLALRRMPANAASIPWHRRAECGVALGALLALLAAVADDSLARAARDGPLALARQVENVHAAKWFDGHWGVQWYLEARPEKDFRILDTAESVVQPGDLLLLPREGANLADVPPQAITPALASVEIATFPLAATMDIDSSAGFYSDRFGGLPFSLGQPSPQQFTINQAVQKIVLRDQFAAKR